MSWIRRLINADEGLGWRLIFLELLHDGGLGDNVISFLMNVSETAPKKIFWKMIFGQNASDLSSP
jgi:hypothetical protein